MITEQSYTRITLALDIVGRIPDGPQKGYHELAVIKHQIDLHDVISVDHAPLRSIACNDARVPCDERNICWKAAALVRERFGISGDVSIRIDKRIPVMGGLAGGSANAATTLALLDRLWGLGMTKGSFEEIGRKLGMDVPFYFTGGTALDAETGGPVKPVDTSLSFTFVIVVPTFGVSTADAYAGVDYGLIGARRHETQTMIAALRAGDRDAVVAAVHNDFEATVFVKHPSLRAMKEVLLEHGCAVSFLSGSGSTVIGMCVDKVDACRIAAAMRPVSDVERVLVCHTLMDAR